MATQRYVSTSFWDDSWIRSLNPQEKFLYLYLMTNSLTNIAGVYKITLERISFDTGLKCAVVEQILEKFTKQRKACLYGEYIIIPAWPNHQKWEVRSKIKVGIEIILERIPESVKKYMVQIGYRYPIEGYVYEPNYPDSDSDSDLDLLDKNLEDTLSSFGTEDGPKLNGEVAEFIEGEKREACRVPHKEIISFLNEACHTKYSHESDYIRRLLKARWNEGYRLPDFQAVIRVKAKQWLNDPKMVKYLRPITLFSASKFDGYLQETAHIKEAEKNRCPQCGGQNGRHVESCPVLQRANNKKPRDGPEELPAF